MKTFSSIFFFFVSIVFSYCQVLFHPINFVDKNGDTINRLNNSNQFEGLQIISDNPKMFTSDTNFYQKGYFNNGLPEGEWITHEASGHYSKGVYLKKHLTSDSMRFDEKTGVWINFNKDSIKSKTEYLRNKKNTITKITEFASYRVPSKKHVIFFSKYKRSKDNINHVVKQFQYSDQGNLQKKIHKNFIQLKLVDYYPNGNKKHKYVRSYITHKRYFKDYDCNGKIESKGVLRF